MCDADESEEAGATTGDEKEVYCLLISDDAESHHTYSLVEQGKEGLKNNLFLSTYHQCHQREVHQIRAI